MFSSNLLIGLVAEFENEDGDDSGIKNTNLRVEHALMMVVTKQRKMLLLWISVFDKEEKTGIVFVHYFVFNLQCKKNRLTISSSISNLA